MEHAHSTEGFAATELKVLVDRQVLVVDDSRPMLLFTQRLLELLGAKVRCADDGEEALRLVGTQAFDLLLVDIELPGIDGCEVAQTLRANGITVPIVAVTAHSEPHELARCMECGFDACLSKPFSKATLLSTVSPLLNAPSRPRSP